MAAVVRERFLSEAATLLKDVSPSVAQDARIQNLELRRTGEMDTFARTQTFCRACGSDAIENSTVPTKVRPQRGSGNVSEDATQLGARDIIIRKCQVCSRSWKEMSKETCLVQIEQANVRPTQQPQDDATDDKSRTANQQKISSKKRAKERRDRDGLKALMNRKIDHSKSSGNAFNLMDFFTNQT